MTMSLISDDSEFIRKVATVSMDRLEDSAFVVYQAHRSLLWIGDIDGASRLVSILRSSDLPEDIRFLVILRQACAENRTSDAEQIYDRLIAEYPNNAAIVWISHSVMNQRENAIATLMELDQSEDLRAISSFLAYAYFDAKQYPNLLALLESQGIEPREPRDIPYQCKL